MKGNERESPLDIKRSSHKYIRPPTKQFINLMIQHQSTQLGHPMRSEKEKKRKEKREKAQSLTKRTKLNEEREGTRIKKKAKKKQTKINKFGWRIEVQVKLIGTLDIEGK